MDREKEAKTDQEDGRPDAHRPFATTNQAVGAGIDHPSVDNDPGGDRLGHPSNRIDFNDSTSHLRRDEPEAEHEEEPAKV